MKKWEKRADKITQVLNILSSYGDRFSAEGKELVSPLIESLIAKLKDELEKEVSVAEGWRRYIIDLEHGESDHEIVAYEEDIKIFRKAISILDGKKKHRQRR